jgi:hypothetical protein
VDPSERGGWGCPRRGRPRGAFTLAVGSQVIELLPHQQSDDGLRAFEAETIAPAQAILGRHYELVVSSPLGCLRLRTDEHVQVVGFDPPTSLVPTPRPRVIRLRPPPQEVALEGISMVGVWLTAAVRQAFRPEDPALVAATIGPDPGAIDVAQTSTRALKGGPVRRDRAGRRRAIGGASPAAAAAQAVGAGGGAGARTGRSGGAAGEGDRRGSAAPLTGL